MECRIIGEKYLITNTYDIISIQNRNGRRRYVNCYATPSGFVSECGSKMELSKIDFDVIIDSSQKNILCLLDIDNTKNNKMLNWHIINQLSGFDIVEEVISYFLANNIINCISIQSKENEETEPLDYHFKLSSKEDKILNIKLDFDVDSPLKKYFEKNIMNRIYLKYKNDCLQFFKEHSDKKIYCYDTNNTKAQFYTSLVCNSLVNYFLEDDFQNQEVVIVKDGITDKCKIFEERLGLEQEKAFLEELDNKIIKVTCNDCIFIFMAKVCTPQIIRNIVESHNRSIEKGRRLLMALESVEKELW